jgi:hypothetical protein
MKLFSRIPLQRGVSLVICAASLRHEWIGPLYRGDCGGGARTRLPDRSISQIGSGQQTEAPLSCLADLIQLVLADWCVHALQVTKLLRCIIRERHESTSEHFEPSAQLQGFTSALSVVNAIVAPRRSPKLGIERKTIRRWLRRGQFPERKPQHRRPPKVNEFAEYLQQRWNEGCHNVSRLYQEIREKGYQGKRAMVARIVAGWRKTGKAASSKAPERSSPKHATILVTRPAEQMTDEQQQLFDRITTQCLEVINLRLIALSFRAALTADESTQLRQWIEGAKHSEFGAVVRFACGLQKDISAVAAAVDTSWSTGQVEGQINRLKAIKRQMDGRAGFELLRARVLPYSPAATAGPAP